MLVPRSYPYKSPSSPGSFDEKKDLSRSQESMSTRYKRPGWRPSSPARMTTEPARVPSPPIAVRPVSQTRSTTPHTASTTAHGPQRGEEHSRTAHNPKALPPAVAALLAVTQIPPPRPGQFQRRSRNARRVSIEELVNEWKNDDSLNASYDSSSALSILLEDTDGTEGQPLPDSASFEEAASLSQRSTSSESVPSLDARSTWSNGSLSTPESLCSRPSALNLKRQMPRSLPVSEDCSFEHPLVATQSEDDGPDDGFILSRPLPKKTSASPPTSTFTSNLTLSIQSLKKAAISSISSLSFSSSNSVRNQQASQQVSATTFSNDVLWSHPSLFPRFTSEIRPEIDGDATEAQRCYFNPMPLTFEEQETPFQLALHAPFLAEAIDSAPLIQMQTYTRGKRKGTSRRGSLDPESEAGRAMLAGAGVRHREPRENGDFLRVVVMEMNMKRAGKLAVGRARLWLPPREVTSGPRPDGKVPRRWIGQSAYELE